MLKNFIYIPYYVIKTPWATLVEYVKFLANTTERSYISYCIDMFFSSIKYGTSFMDYFQLRLFEKNNFERAEYAGTGFMYEFQLKMNPIGERQVLSDKVKFLEHFDGMHGRKWFVISQFDKKKQEIVNLLNNSKKIVLKDSKGQAGKQVEVINTMSFDKLKNYMDAKGLDLLEEYVIQHENLSKLAPKALNTIRIITQLNRDDEIDLIGTIIRLSIDSTTDNLSTGNTAALIDLKTGIVCRKAVFADFRKEDIEYHPITNEKITGFEIPCWDESIALVKKAALHVKENRSIGWDIAITNSGPILIEANHNWGRTLWQLPANKGLKSILQKYM